MSEICIVGDRELLKLLQTVGLKTHRDQQLPTTLGPFFPMA